MKDPKYVVTDPEGNTSPVTDPAMIAHLDEMFRRRDEIEAGLVDLVPAEEVLTWLEDQ